MNLEQPPKTAEDPQKSFSKVLDEYCDKLIGDSLSWAKVKQLPLNELERLYITLEATLNDLVNTQIPEDISDQQKEVYEGLMGSKKTYEETLLPALHSLIEEKRTKL